MQQPDTLTIDAFGSAGIARMLDAYVRSHGAGQLGVIYAARRDRLFMIVEIAEVTATITLREAGITIDMLDAASPGRVNWQRLAAALRYALSKAPQAAQMLNPASRAIH